MNPLVNHYGLETANADTHRLQVAPENDIQPVNLALFQASYRQRKLAVALIDATNEHDDAEFQKFDEYAEAEYLWLE